MKKIREQWREQVLQGLGSAAAKSDIDPQVFTPEMVIAETPPNPEMGDLAFPMFPFARHFKKAPPVIAEILLEELVDSVAPGVVHATGPYLNITYNMAAVSEVILDEIKEKAGTYGKQTSLAGKKVMVEFSCPNTNKPLHLGHLRNDAIGESLSNILSENGAEVLKANLVNNRGIHICKSMAAYQKFGGDATPEQQGIKSDHFVGDYYVKYSEWEAADPGAEEKTRELLRKWEAGDPDTIALWEKMNHWTLDGIQETYNRTGISFDKVYLESDTYTSGRDKVQEGLDKGVFFQEDDGSVWIDLAEINLDKKILLRSDGTSVYMTQDIGTAIQRHIDVEFDQLIYVVAAEQEYHFTVLFHVLKRLGYKWADNLYHFSYGMVNLPDGKMKSREGTVVDADDLLDMLSGLAAEEIVAKEREGEVENLGATAEAIARAAVNYYLLQVTPGKDMVFDPDESISFNGNTGPYLQYTGARLSSMNRKFEERRGEFEGGNVDTSLIQGGDEWEVVKLLGGYPDVVESAAVELNPTAVANHLYNLCKMYSRYYHDNPVLHNSDPNLVHTRIAISKGVVQVLKNGFGLIGIPFLEKM